MFGENWAFITGGADNKIIGWTRRVSYTFRTARSSSLGDTVEVLWEMHMEIAKCAIYQLELDATVDGICPP